MATVDATRIVRGHTVPPRDPKGTREGYTTGTCAAAATAAASAVLLGRGWPDTVTLELPAGRTLEVRINTLAWDGTDTATAGVVKDGGDDPDVTHGAEVFAAVRRVAAPGVVLKGGKGVGTVTKPGLGLPVGGPAINPVPERMIRKAVADAFGSEIPDPGVEVTVSVPGGAEIARRTFNPRLGIVGGISILGTTGVVRPMSTAAWRAAVRQQIDVAAANGVARVVLTTGGRTEKYAAGLYPELPEVAFVEMGIFTGDSLRHAADRGFRAATVGAMVGKMSKLAAGHLQTHRAGNQVDCPFLGRLARDLGASEELAAAVSGANTARHVQELVAAANFPAFFGGLCERALEACWAAAGGRLAVEVILFDFDGPVLGRASRAAGGSPH